MPFETLVNYCILFDHCLGDSLVSYDQLTYCYEILFFVCIYEILLTWSRIGVGSWFRKNSWSRIGVGV